MGAPFRRNWHRRRQDGTAELPLRGRPPHQCRAQRSAAAPARKQETLGVVIPASAELGIQQSQAVGCKCHPISPRALRQWGCHCVGWVTPNERRSQGLPSSRRPICSGRRPRSRELWCWAATLLWHYPGFGLNCVLDHVYPGGFKTNPCSASRLVRGETNTWSRTLWTMARLQKHAVLECQFWGEHRGSIGRDGYGAALDNTSHYAICMCSKLLQCHRCWQFPISTSHAACKARAYWHRYSIAPLLVRPSLHGLRVGPFCTVSVKRGCVACAIVRLTLHHCQFFFRRITYMIFNPRLRHMLPL